MHGRLRSRCRWSTAVGLRGIPRCVPPARRGRGAELVEWLHGDVEFAARAAQVPDPGNRPVDEQHREVSRLASGSQRAFGSPAGEEQLARLPAERVGIEVR